MSDSKAIKNPQNSIVVGDNVFPVTEFIWCIGSTNMLFRRSSNRYGRKGTFSNNNGYKRVMRNALTGRFVPIA